MKRRDILCLLGAAPAFTGSGAQTAPAQVPMSTRHITTPEPNSYPAIPLDREVVTFNIKRGRFEKLTVGRVRLKFFDNEWREYPAHV